MSKSKSRRKPSLTLITLRARRRWPNNLWGAECAILYSITTNQAAIIALFRVVNRYVGNLAPMPGVFPDYPAPVVRNTDTGTRDDA